MSRVSHEKTARLPSEVEEMLKKFPNINITKLARNLETTVVTLEKLLSEGKITWLPKKVTNTRQRSVWGTKNDTLYN